MKKLLIVTAAAAVAMAFASSAGAQSAKFAATWDTEDKTAVATAACSNAAGGCADSDGPNLTAELNLATIHVGTRKSVLIGVSSQIGIHLITVAKGKGSTGGNLSSTALAEGDVVATITLENQDPSGADCVVAPGPIVLKAESRELKVSATVTDDDITVEVSIDTDSVSATHFNFLGVECDQGWYDANINFALSALAEASGFDANSHVTVTLGDRLITLQEVRAVKGSLVEG